MNTDDALVHHLTVVRSDTPGELSIETASEAVHSAWMEAQRELGYTSRISPDGVEMMVGWAELPEHIRELDRTTVRAVIVSLHAHQPESAST